MIKTIKTVNYSIKYGINFLNKSDIIDRSNINLDVRILISHILNTDIKKLFFILDTVLTEQQFQQFNLLLKQRLLGKPVYKIIGFKPFFKHNFITNENVLDPRIDTEILVESVIKYYKDKNEHINFLELGSGSGCIILSLLSEFKNSKSFAIDISKEAIETMHKNIYNMALQDRITLIQKDWNNLQNSDFNKSFDGFDCVISNPPYIKTSEIDNLSLEVKKFDPKISLDGGEDGIKCYKEIASKLIKQDIKLKDNAKIFLEIGYNQKNDVINIFTAQGFKFITYQNDINNIPRVLIFSI